MSVVQKIQREKKREKERKREISLVHYQT